MSHNKYLYGILVLFVVVLFACKKEKPDCGKCKDIIGKWKFDHVTYRKNFSPYNTDLTSAYRDIRLTFFSDSTILFEHATRNITLTGYWTIGKESNDNGYYSSSIAYLDWTAESGNNYEEGKWDNITINRKGMRTTETKYGGTYRFHLIRE